MTGPAPTPNRGIRIAPGRLPDCGATPGAKPNWRRWPLWLGAMLLGLSVLGAIGGWFWHPRSTPPAFPPVLDLEGTDPVVAAVLEKERQHVLQAPRSAAAWGKLGLLLTAFNYRLEAVACLDQAGLLDPNEPRWPYHQGLLLLLDHPNEALPCLRRAAELGGENVVLRLRLSETLLALGQLDEAEEGFRRVRQRDSGNGPALLGLGRVALQREHWSQARSYLEAALADRHCKRAATVALVQVHQHEGNTETATRLRDRSEHLPPDVPWSDPYIEEVHALHVGKRVRLSQANRLFKRGRANEAIVQLKELTADYPDSPEVWFALGQVLHGCGAYPAAEQAMGQVVKRTPGNAEAHNYLGAAQMHQGKLTDAENALRKAIELKPDFALAYSNLGRCLLQQQNREGALAACRDAVRCKPDYDLAHTELAELLHQMHRDDEALLEVRRALQVNPGNSRAEQLRKKVESQPTATPANTKLQPAPP